VISKSYVRKFLQIKRLQNQLYGRLSPSPAARQKKRWFRRGQAWRAGIEARLSTLKHPLIVLVDVLVLDFLGRGKRTDCQQRSSTSKGVPDENTRKCRSGDKIDNRQYREKSFKEIFKLLGGEPTSQCAGTAFMRFCCDVVIWIRSAFVVVH
jgi:hypothetical protein